MIFSKRIYQPTLYTYVTKNTNAFTKEELRVKVSPLGFWIVDDSQSYVTGPSLSLVILSTSSLSIPLFIQHMPREARQAGFL